jgi:hypothetical protein
MTYVRHIFLIALMCFALPVFAKQNEWHISVVDGDIDARITYYSQMHQTEAVWVKEAIETAWPKYQLATGVRPATTVGVHVGDVFLMNPQTQESSAPHGLTGYEDGVCTIYIQPKDERLVKTTTVHELFHCWQNAMKLQPYTQNKWMWEATAVWSEDWIYKNYGSEHQYDTALFKALDANLLDTGSNHEYGSYLYFYKLYQQAGFSPTPVIDLVKQLKNKNQAQVIKSQAGLDDSIKEFALWNWNKDPFKEYIDSPNFPDTRPSGTSIKPLPIAQRGEYKAKFRTEGGGAQYVGVGFEEGIDKVVFNISEYNSLVKPEIGMQALIKINDQWHYEDWSYETEKTYCRNREAEKVQMVVLIASNSTIVDTVSFGTDGIPQYTDGGAHSGEMTIDASGECPSVWHGTVTYTFDGGGTVLPVHQTLTVHEELEEVMNERGDMEFQVKSAEFDYHATQSMTSPCPFLCSGEISTQSESKGNTTRHRPDSETRPAKRFEVYDDGSIVFIADPQIYGACDYVTTRESTKYECECDGGDFGISVSKDSWSDLIENECHTINGIEVVHKIPTEFSTNAKRITGIETGTSQGGNYGATISWDYVYE